MKEFRIAVLGATGAVGREMVKVLEEYDIPISELRLLASARSAGGTVPFKGQEIVVQEAREESFEGCDFVLGAVQNPLSKHFAPAIRLHRQQLRLPHGEGRSARGPGDQRRRRAAK